MATVELNIWDEKIRITAEGESSELIKRAAEFLNEKMEIVKAEDPSVITTKIIALRAAYLIAAEFMLMQDSVTNLELAVEKIQEQLIQL